MSLGSRWADPPQDPAERPGIGRNRQFRAWIAHLAVESINAVGGKVGVHLPPLGFQAPVRGQHLKAPDQLVQEPGQAPPREFSGSRNKAFLRPTEKREFVKLGPRSSPSLPDIQSTVDTVCSSKDTRRHYVRENQRFTAQSVDSLPNPKSGNE